jgi:hypothetical protein
MEEQVCIEPPDLLVVDGVGAQARAGPAGICCDPHVMWGKQRLESNVQPAGLV